MANLLVFVLSISLGSVLTSSVPYSIPGAPDLASSSSSSASSSVVIVYTDPPTNEQPEAYNIKTLASVLGSVEAAKESLVYTYTNVASCFSARLTPDQVAKISKQPGVVNVVQSATKQLHLGGVGGGGGAYGISTLH